MTLSAMSIIQQIPLETKYRDNISRSTSNNSTQADEFNISDVLVNSPIRNTQSSKRALSPSVTLFYLY